MRPPGGALSVNGARDAANNFLLNGTDNNYQAFNQYTVLPSIDAIQEFKVQSSNSSAEFGRNAGAQINVVLKSGTNDLHGTAFEFFRNRNLDAKNFFDRPDCTPVSVPGTCAEIPRFDRNQFGGTLGGPLQRDRSFFFISYEGLRLRQAITRQATVPSQAERAAALAAIPSFLRNPAGEAAFNLYPAANGGSDLTTSNTFVSSPVLRVETDQFIVRIDHQAGPNDNLSGHYAIDDVDENIPFGLAVLGGIGNLPGFGNIDSNRSQNLGISWTHIATPRVVNEFRFGFNRFGSLTSHANAGVNGNQQLGFPEVLTDPRDLGFPEINVAGFERLGDPVLLPVDLNPTTIQFSDNLVWLPKFHGGRHQIKFGADIRRVGSKEFSDWFGRGRWDFLGVATGSSLADLLLGIPAFAIGVRGDNFTDIRTDSLNFYVQDDIRVTPRFTLNLGLRYEYNQPPREPRNRFSVPDLSDNSITCTPKPDCQFFLAGSNGIPRGTYNNDLNNFAPRFGLAWRPLPTERFVVRAGYGIFYDVSVFARSFFMTINPPIYTIAASINNGTNTIQDILDQPGLKPTSSLVSPDVRDAYMQHWNLNLQYEWLQDLLLDIAYVGSKGTNLGAARDINQIDPATGTQPFPQFARINSFESRASSNYHSLQLRAEQRLRSGLTFLASYTW